MSPSGDSDTNTATLRDYLQVLRRRKAILVAAVLSSMAAAGTVSYLQDALYEASAEVLLSRQNLTEGLTGLPDGSASLEADRDVQTQVQLARVPEVARRVLVSARVDAAAADFLAASSVSARTNTDLLVFRVRDRSPGVAQRLATAYARQYTKYRSELDTAAVARALSEVESRVEELEAEGQRSSQLYADLLRNEQQLRQMEALLTSNAFVVRAAESSSRVEPRPKRNLALGLVLGVALGLGLGFLREALDTRVRTSEEISAKLGVPLLARIAPPPRRLERQGELVMLAEPFGPQAEAFRMLRTSLEFVRLGREVRTLMVSSAVEREGKSTTIANLAVALALGGQRVVLVDLDLRRPYIARFFGLAGAAGLTSVALGHVELDDALHAIALPDGAHGATNGSTASESRLHVLPAGPPPPDAGEFVNTAALGEILDELTRRTDIVLVDAPPMLHVGDAMTLSARVDALFLVTRANVLRRQMLVELRRMIDAAPVQTLGFVATGDADGADAYGYAYRYESTRREGAGVS